MTSCLALDLGTKTGWAYNRGDNFQAGTWHLMSAKDVTIQARVRLDRRKDARVERLCEKLTALGKFDVVVFEDITFSTYRLQQQLWASLRSAAWLCAEGSLFEAVNVQTLKKFAGAGSNDKAAMFAALKRQHPELWRPEYDDNAIDACWLWLYAKQNLTRINTQPKLP